MYAPFSAAVRLTGRGKTIWGSDADRTALEADLQLLRGNFTGIPLLLGEFGASPTNTEPAARWKYDDYLMRMCAKYDIAHMLWDNGLDDLDRSTGIWRDPATRDLVTQTSASVRNSLPDSTEDGSATSQWTSAYLFHKVDTPVIEQSLPFLLNGNTLSSIRDSRGSLLSSGPDYTVTGSNITFSAACLSNYLSPNAATGNPANLTLTFSSGFTPYIQVIQWDSPTLASNSAAAADVSGSDLAIPITWAGIPKPAAVKAVMADGTGAFAPWTKYLGPLQQLRAASRPSCFCLYPREGIC